MQRVRLVKKLANNLNGVDVSRFGVGDVLELVDPVASMMIAEGWAQPVLDRPEKSPAKPQGAASRDER